MVPLGRSCKQQTLVVDRFDLARDGASYGRKWCLASSSSGDQIDVYYLNTVFELYSGYHLGQVVEAA
jgi:hypothetical protein